MPLTPRHYQSILRELRVDLILADTQVDKGLHIRRALRSIDAALADDSDDNRMWAATD